MTTIKDDSFNIIKEIPIIPDVIQKINDFLKNQSCGIDYLANYIEEDEELKKSIINIANSRYFILTQPLNTVRSVIISLGIMKTKNIILALSLKKIMDLDNNNFLHLWLHSIKCAIACEIIAKENSIISTDDAFSLGLLHDIGKAVLYKNNTNDFLKNENKVLNENEDIIELENNIFSTNHSIYSSMILKKWRMPKILADCIEYHHTPTLSPIPPASGIIYFADKIIKNDLGEINLENQIMNRLGIYINDIKTLKTNINVKTDFYIEPLN